jgi:hypothetical protein
MESSLFSTSEYWCSGSIITRTVPTLKSVIRVTVTLLGSGFSYNTLY